MRTEKERRFLVTVIAEKIFKEVLGDGVGIIQGYLYTDDPQVRVRTEDGERGFLTIKAKIEGVDGVLEPQSSIPLDEAQALLKIHKYHLVRKIRHKIKRFEIDIFQDRLDGLVKAEIELDDFKEKTEIPAGLVVREVTGDERFENQNLAKLDKLPEEWRCKIVESL